MERFLKSRYKIGEKISENPFSVTYKGAFLGTHKPVVIKIYKRGTLNSSLINRMKQKVREFSQINHHGIAKLIDGDYGWQGFYYVREYIKGESLRHLLESDQNIGVEKAVKIAEEVCQALEFAHNRGIIHGAIKPNNIFIDSHGVVKIADFVIEGEIREAMPQKILSIMDDGRYASPEELAGNPASASSDVYALGMILYELSVSRSGMVEEGLSSGLIKLRSKSLLNQEDLAGFPRYFQEVVCRALRADPQLRFPSMAEFRESLEKKNLVTRPLPHEEYITLFENTVTQYGGEELDKESESLEELGRVKISWGKEKHRNWILALVLGIAFLSGILYVFLFAW